MIDVVIRDTPVLTLVVGKGSVFVVVVGLWVERDDVPGVEEAGDVAEGAEEDVDEAVGGANAGFDPDGYGGEEDGEEAEEDVAAAHGFCGFFESECGWVGWGCVEAGGFDGVVECCAWLGRVEVGWLAVCLNLTV